MHFETDKMKGLVDDLEPEDFRDNTIYESNYQLKRKIGRPQLTAARIVCSAHSKKVFFGQPDPLLIIEDACARLTLAQLEDLFDESVQEQHESQASLG